MADQFQEFTAKTPDGKEWSVKVPAGMDDAKRNEVFKKFAAEHGGKKPVNPVLDVNPFLGVAEAGAELVTGAGAKVISDVAGLAAAGREAVSPTGASPKAPGRFAETLREQMTYRPRGTAGKMVSQYNPAALVGQGWDATARGAAGLIEGDATNPVRSAVAHAVEEGLKQAPQFIPGLVGRGKGRTVRPDVATLSKEGVKMTPGQMVGGAIQRAEDAATSLPILGDAIRSAQRRGIESFDAAAFNRALSPLGERLPKGMKGHEAVIYTYEKLGDAYDALLPKMKGDMNAGLRQELDTLKQMGQDGLAADHLKQLNRIIDKEVTAKFTPDGLASGETLQNISEQLKKEANDFRRGGPFDRQLAGAIDEVGAALRRMIDQVNPQYAGELKKVNEGYANFKRAQAAAGYSGSKEGVFTPSQLDRSVRAGDKYKDKARYSEGNALMQDLSGAGKRTLSQTVPDSGTPIRAAIMWALNNPVRATVLGIPITMLSAAYTPFGQAALESYLLKSPSVRQALTSAAGRGMAYGVGAESQTARDQSGALLP